MNRTMILWLFTILGFCTAHLASHAAGQHLFYRPEHIFAPKEGEMLCYEWRELINDLDKRTKVKVSAINKRETELQGSANSVNPNDLEKVADILKEREALKVDQQMLQRTIEQDRTDILRTFEHRVQNVLDQFLRERKADSITPLTHGAVCRAELDITDDIIERLNEEYRKEQRAKKLKAAQPTAPTPKSVAAKA